jgi:phosphoglycolate phosphatase-like HAD superfamily hydrolase
MQYKTILLDFDGVISDSNSFKALNIFKAARRFVTEEAASQFRDYFVANNGVPREKKIFGYFSDKEQAQAILDEYNSLNKKLSEAKLTLGLKEFLEKNKSCTFIVLSGGDTREIINYLKDHGIESYFSDVLGGPETKEEHMKKKPLSHAVFFGDTMYDHNIAEKFNLDFIFVYGYTSETDWDQKLPGDIKRIKNFSEI